MPLNLRHDKRSFPKINTNILSPTTYKAHDTCLQDHQKDRSVKIISISSLSERYHQKRLNVKNTSAQCPKVQSRNNNNLRTPTRTHTHTYSTFHNNYQPVQTIGASEIIDNCVRRGKREIVKKKNTSLYSLLSRFALLIFPLYTQHGRASIVFCA